MSTQNLHKSIVYTNDKHLAHVLQALVIDVARNMCGRAGGRESSGDANDQTFAFDFVGETDFTTGRVFHKLDIGDAVAYVDG